MTQKVFIGTNSIDSIDTVINDLKIKTVLLVTGKSSYNSNNINDKLTSNLLSTNITRFNDFSVNPKIEDTIKGIKIFNSTKPDAVIAVGGGSVIDMAKQINILAVQDSDNIHDIIKNKNDITKPGKPLIAIPTTTGTGSESTHFAVTYINKIKYSLAHQYMLPDYCIIDPVFSYTMPPYLTATCGMDALTQSIESYWSVNSTNESKRYAKESISLILKNIENAVKGIKEARNEMALAAHFSGKAINISKTTAPHAISYPLSMYFNISHGHAVALTLGYFFNINTKINEIDVVDSRGKKYVLTTMNEIFDLFSQSNANHCKKFWYKLMQNIKLETNISKLGIRSKQDIEKIIENIDPVRIKNNPTKINKTIIKNILQDLQS
ncbi:MAG: alcohol dehydrogenase [Gammaproteobacteria bacterium]|nr:alcohol dehydrogenase [Gammaproteobacteria bacterium]